MARARPLASHRLGHDSCRKIWVAWLVQPRGCEVRMASKHGRTRYNISEITLFSFSWFAGRFMHFFFEVGILRTVVVRIVTNVTLPSPRAAMVFPTFCLVLCMLSQSGIVCVGPFRWRRLYWVWRCQCFVLGICSDKVIWLHWFVYSEYFWILLDHLQPQVAIGNPLSLSVRSSMNLRLKIQVEFFSQKRKVLADSKIGPFTGAAAIIGACLNAQKMYMFCGEMPHIANCRKGNTSTRYRQHVHPLDPPSDIFACTWISYRLVCCPCVLLPSTPRQPKVSAFESPGLTLAYPCFRMARGQDLLFQALFPVMLCQNRTDCVLIILICLKHELFWEIGKSLLLVIGRSTCAQHEGETKALAFPSCKGWLTMMAVPCSCYMLLRCCFFVYVCYYRVHHDSPCFTR